MSWSVGAIGKPAAVLAKLDKDFLHIHLREPEQTIARLAYAAIASSLEAYPPGFAVKVAANGSQYVPDDKQPAQAVNALTVSIEPLHGFAE